MQTVSLQLKILNYYTFSPLKNFILKILKSMV